MTNLDYVKTLSAEELANYIYSTIITIGKQYTESQLGVANWLKEERVVPAKHGHWIDAEGKQAWSSCVIYGRGYYECSNCGKVSWVLKGDVYCPYCKSKNV